MASVVVRWHSSKIAPWQITAGVCKPLIMEIIVTFIVVAGIIALVLWLAVTRGLQLKQLVEDGVDIDGVVVRQFKHNPKGIGISNHLFA